LIGPGVAKALPVTVVLMGFAAVAAMGLPPFGLFYSELTVIGGGFAASKTLISTLVLVALLASFCGMLKQLTRILLGSPRRKPTVTIDSDAARSESVAIDFGGSTRGQSCPRSALDAVPAMGLLLVVLLLFSIWMPASIFQLLKEAARIVGGRV
jgi:hydrogenase-4 component F